MRIRRRSDRRVSSTRRIGVVAAPGTARRPGSDAPSGARQRGLRRRRLPVPAEERAAGRPGRPVAVLQPRVHLVRRLAAQLREPGRVQRLLAGRSTGATPRTGRTPPSRLEHPGRQQPDPRRRRVVVGRLGRVVARPRRLGADRRRRRDHDRGVQLPPRRHVRHPHHLQLELDVAERLHPHQGHRQSATRRRRPCPARRRSARS